MIEKVIEWSLRHRFLLLCGALLLTALGVRAVKLTPVDAIPDLTENQVLVFADWMGRSPQEVEDQVTFPLSSGLQGLAGVREVRATSMFGFSLVTIVFDEGVDTYFARSRVLERLNFLQGQMPEGVTPQLGPDATGLGWVYQYYLHVDPATAPDGGYDLAQLRSLQDWKIRYDLASVPGVAEVASIGGFVKQYQVELSSAKMRATGVTLMDVIAAVQNANLNVGGKTVEENGAEFVLRGIGLITGPEDLELVAVKAMVSTPVYLKDIATIQIGGDYRRGALDINGVEAVGGTVVMRSGENAKAVIGRVKEKIAAISPSLPPGVSLRPFYDRSELIDKTIDTLKHALVEEIILVTLAHIVFLWHFRSILIVTLPLPISILISFLLMKEMGITSNIMSLTGIAIAIGVLVDAAIVVTENVIRHGEREEREKGRPLTPAERWHTTLAASKQVGRPIFFAMAIILLAFVPVFALTGQEGKLFRPLAFTKSFAVLGATILGVTLVPVLCSFLVKGPYHEENRHLVMRALMRLYEPTLSWALKHPRSVVGAAVILLAACLLVAFGLPRAATARLRDAGFAGTAELFRGFGKEFMPPLNEGALLHMPVLMPKTGFGEIQRVMSWQDRVMAQVPEIEIVAGKLGRFETATDPAPTEMLETTIMLKPEYLPDGRFLMKRNPAWRDGMTVEKLKAELTEKMKGVPGYVPAFLQPIENRILMLYTGIRAQLGVKIYGDDLEAIQRKAFEIEKLINEVPGAAGVSPSRVQGKPYLEIEVDRHAMARYGLNAKDVLDAVEVAIGGKNVSTAIEGRQRFPIQIRVERGERDDIEKLGRLLIATKPGLTEAAAQGPPGAGMGGAMQGATASPAAAGTPGTATPPFIPLGLVARISRETGANEIASENGQLRAYVQANVRDRDLGGFVQEVEEKLKAVDWQGLTWKLTGEHENQKRFTRAMVWVFPTVLLIIFVLLFMVFRDVLEAAHVMLAVPFALSGGVILQKILGYNFNGAVWVGYIALFGTAVQTGVVMVVYLNEAVNAKRAELGHRFAHGDLVQAVMDGAKLRLRPKVMTVTTTVASLLPIMWSTRQGAEVMKPLATPVIGGMISSLLHILIVTPVIFLWLHSRLGQRHPPGSRRFGEFDFE
jgi:Cu(I)/Ag(I) efflux system membrane protein CusA/SilA